jgi:hypothetical protein
MIGASEASMIDTQQTVKAALALLEDVKETETEPPATVILPPDSGGFIIGNAQGFVKLAMASLRAAQGEEQSFKDYPWWVDCELDWSLPGLKPDPSAHVYLPPRRDGLRHLLIKAFGYGLFFTAAICLIVGIGTIIYWLRHLI